MRTKKDIRFVCMTVSFQTFTSKCRRCPRPTRARGKSAYIYFRPCPEGDVVEFKVKRIHANEKKHTCT